MLSHAQATIQILFMDSHLSVFQLYSEEPIETAIACDISPQVGMWNVQLDPPLLNSTEVYDSPSSVERVLPRNWRRNMSPVGFASVSLQNYGFSLDGNRMQRQSHQAVQQPLDVKPNIVACVSLMHYTSKIRCRTDCHLIQTLQLEFI
ncbi:unnamed protein product [Auanema sp. JU1783]|nr:unnamed protein product [Auanema sp. JU1783]